jgi:thermosome
MGVAIPAEIGGQPVLILKEGTSRTRGREALRNNIVAAKIVAELMRTTLGPKGMDKMLIDSLGDVTVTNDGATILDEMDVQHPAAKMMVEMAKAQDKEVGDGTTSVVVFAGELLKKAEYLLDQNIHSTTIVSGYKKAASEAVKHLHQIAQRVERDDRDILRKVVKTSVESKSVSVVKEHIADIAIDAVRQIAEQRGKRWMADTDQIQVIKKTGESLFDTSLVRGVIVDKEVVHPAMPKSIEKAKIALLDTPLEVEKTEFSAEIRIRDPSQMKAFLDEETRILKEMVDKVNNVGANVIFCQKGIDDMAQHFLAKQKILAVRRVKKSDMEKLARATGAKIVTNLESLKPEDLGYADLVEEKKVAGDKIVFVEGCKEPRSVSVLIRGGLERMVDEAERSVHDGLCVVADVIEDNHVVAGGGAIEAELARKLRQYAPSVGGREQLAIEAFADALEAIPRTLAENAGLDPIDMLMTLRAAHEKEGGKWMGINLLTGKVDDMWKKGVIEPASVKEQMIKAATEMASAILRIDDLIAAAKPKMEKGKEKFPGAGETGIE